MGRKAGLSDPDRGTESYTYDPNGNLTHASDARGQLVYTGYDGINRPLWRNTSPAPTGAYVTYSYDSTANGNVGIGRLTGESFSNRNAPGGGGGSLSGSYAYTYDERGQTTSMTQTLGGTGGTGGGSYTFGTSYDDSGQPTSLTYPDGAVLSLGADASSGWPTSAVTTPSGGGAAINLATGLSYSGTGNAGAAGAVTSATIGNGVYQYAASYDGDLRPTSASTTRNSDGATLFSSGRTYDALGNVTSTTTQLPAGSGTDTQAFCYDDLDRLVWAGTSGTPPCSAPVTPSSSVAGAAYQQSFAYDNLNRLTSGPLGSYTYGDASHLHAATAIGSSYSASYDASGNMTCRAPSGGGTCAGASPTGQQLTYDTEGNLVGWQDAPSNPTSTASVLYDGEGDRVEQVTTSTAGGGTSTTTRYLGGGLEEIATTGSTTQVTKYYPTGVGGVTAISVNGTYSYLASDGLGSVSVALSSSGGATAQQLYTPYGAVRYSSGAMPGTLGYTGQHSDGPGGLAYYGARYYDPFAGQFISADTVLAGGRNRYAYVGDNPETLSDPSGHMVLTGDEGGATGIYNAGMPNAPLGGADGGDADAAGLALGTEAGDITYALPDGATVEVWDDGEMVTFIGRDGEFEGTEPLAEDPQLAAQLDDPQELDPAQVTKNTDELKAQAHAGQPETGDGPGTTTEPQPPTPSKPSHPNEPTSPQTPSTPSTPNEPQTPDPNPETNATCGESFAADTPVALADGSEQAIGTLTVGAQVEAYDPASGKPTPQTVQHVFVDHDTDLLDVTLRSVGASPSGAANDASRDRTPVGIRGQAPQHASDATGRVVDLAARSLTSEETIHTTASHPWLTADRGFVRAGRLQVGEQVRTADGTTAEVVALRVVPGAANMWDLTVSNVHTFVVGNGQFVVHNCGLTGQPDPANKVPQPAPGVRTPYRGQQLDADVINDPDSGWTRTRQDIAPNTSQDLATFLRAQGKSAVSWEKYMETWQSPEGQEFENHYWMDPFTREAYHYHT